MNNKFYLVLIIVCGCLTFSFAQTQPAQCRIPWSTVTSASFRMTWNGFGKCDSHNITLFSGYTNQVLRTVNAVTETSFQFINLKANTFYGAQVNCITAGKITDTRTCRTRTFASGVVTTTTAPPTGTPPVGRCGTNLFTCSNGTCIPVEYYCNQIIDCSDQSDEFNCPGHCPAVDFDLAIGNYTCTISNSRTSTCYFECNDGYRLPPNDLTYANCVSGKWVPGIPECKVSILDSQGERIDESTFSLELEVGEAVARFDFGEVMSVGGAPLDQDSLEIDVTFDPEFPGVSAIEISGLGPGEYTFSLTPVTAAGDKGVPATITIPEYSASDYDDYPY